MRNRRRVVATSVRAAFFIVYLIISFSVTRGLDGDFLMCIALFTVAGFAYVSIRTVAVPIRGLLGFLFDLVILISASGVGMSFNSRLDEMGGILYDIIPVIVIATVLMAGLGNILIRGPREIRRARSVKE